MAVVFSNNATTVLSSNITNSATSIAVQDGSVFPTLSGTDYFYATLQDPGNTKREIVKVTARSGNTLTVTRAVDGSSASAFSANDALELRLNAAALNDAVNSGTADLELNSFTGDGSEVDFTLSMEALEANTLVYIDGVYQNKTAYSISGYVLTFSAAPDNGAAIEVTTATVAPIQESTDFLLNQFTGDGSDTTFTLSSSPEENQTTVFISGVYQSKSNYSISGTTLTFSTAPPASSSIEVMVARTVVYGIGTPSNDTVSTAKIVDGAVTPAKLSLTYATETFVGTAVSNLVDSSPAALDTLNELAAALGDDPNFATTVTNSIALKAPLASPSFTGTATMDGLTVDATTGTVASLSSSGATTHLDLNNTHANGWGSNVAFQTGGTAAGYFGSIGSLLGTTDQDLAAYSTSGNGFRVYTNGNNERMRIDSSGQVGIGTDSPASLMHLAATAPVLSFTDTNSFTDVNDRFIVRASSDKGNIQWYDDSTSTISELMTFLPSGNVGMGTASPTLASAWNKVLHVQSAGVGSSIRLADSASGTSGDVGLLIGQYSNSSYIINRDSSNMYFWTGGQERVRLDSAGNLLVGTTDDVVWNNSANSAADNGHNLRDDGRAGFAYYNATANSNATVNINRTGSDGDLIRLFKSGTTVGTIGTAGGQSYIYGAGTDVGLYWGSNNIYPMRATGINDATIDIGHWSYRFKDLWVTRTHIANSASSYWTLDRDDSDGSLTFDDTGTERARIDSSGRVGIGDTVPDRKLHVNSGSTNVVAKFESTDAIAAIEFVDSTGSAEIGNSGNNLVFFPAGTERARIDSSGNLLVGYTAADGIGGAPSDNNFSELGKGYINLNRDDLAHATQIQFGKNGAVAGRIHTDDRLSIGTSSTGLYFYNSGNSILPYDNSAATPVTRDNAIDLGSSGARFKDLYLSSGVYLGGTGAANKLDSYEEGTFTSTTSNNNLTAYGSFTGRYTKVGNIVHITGSLPGITAGTGNRFFVFSAPFAQYTSSNFSSGTCTNYPKGNRRSGIVINNSSSNNTQFYVAWNNDSAQSSSDLSFQITYETT